MKRTLSWIAAASFLLAAGNLQAVEVEVPGLLTKMDFDKNVALALAQSEDAINRLQIDKALLSTSDLAKDEF